MQNNANAVLRGIIFDLDGTLANTMPSLIYCINRVLDDLKLEHPPQNVYYEAVGHGAAHFVDTIIRFTSENYSEEFSNRAHKLYMQYFNTYCKRGVNFYPGMQELLIKLCRHGIRLAIVSNKPDPQTQMVVDECLSTEELKYDFVFGQTDVFPKKPDPAVLRHIVAAWGFDTQEIRMVGDGDTDIKAGRKAGIPTVGVSWGYRERAVLVDAGADQVVDSVAELQSLLLNEVDNG